MSILDDWTIEEIVGKIFKFKLTGSDETGFTFELSGDSIILAYLFNDPDRMQMYYSYGRPRRFDRRVFDREETRLILNYLKLL